MLTQFGNIIMKALLIQSQGEPVADQVVLGEVETPHPGPGEVLVRTEASALNHLDLWVGRGLPGIDTPWPRIGGSDGCGRIESLGSGVDPEWHGRRVILNAAIEQPASPHPDISEAGRDLRMIGEHSQGTHAEFFVAPADALLNIGDFPAITAAAAGLAHLTAWRMLRTRARLQAGETVLITGIGGGVALACLNIAKHFGCRTIVTSRSEQKLDQARNLGADEGVLDQGEDWSKAVRTMTARRGVDVCADSIGAATHISCLKSLARAGRFVTCGCTTGPAPQTDLARIFWNQLEVLGSTMGNMQEFREVMSLILKGHFAPVIDLTLPCTEGAEAFRRIESGGQFGKVVIEWN